MQDKIIKWAALFFAVFTGVVMTGVISFGMNREIIYRDNRQNQEVISELYDYENKKYILDIEVVKGDNVCITIPTKESSQDSILGIENDYLQQRIIVKLDGFLKDYYEINRLKVAGNGVESAIAVYQDDCTYIIIKLDTISEHVVRYEKNECNIELFKPEELYEKIVIIDPAHGGDDFGSSIEGVIEKDITLKIASIIKDELDANGIKAYCTRLDDRRVEEEKRVEFCKKISADMIISIHASEGGVNILGAEGIYNDEYFIPKFDSIKLTDCILKNLVESCGTRAIGMEKSELDDMINKLTIPATKIEVGCLGNEKERNALKDEGYLMSIASGVVKGIKSAYEIIEEE